MMTREEYYAAVAEYKETHLEHHGILGQKWGVRRFQKEDGSYTQAGLKRYNALSDSYAKAKADYKNAKSQKDKESANKYKMELDRIKKLGDKTYKDLKKYRAVDRGAKLIKKGDWGQERNRNMAKTFMGSLATGIGSRAGLNYINSHGGSQAPVAAKLLTLGLRGAEIANDSAFWYNAAMKRVEGYYRSSYLTRGSKATTKGTDYKYDKKK